MKNLRFAKNKLVSSENYVTVMIRLHLAHGNTHLYHKMYHIMNVWMYDFLKQHISERFHSIDTKMKGNPLSLEEMILMTIYSWSWFWRSWFWPSNPWRSSTSRRSIRTPLNLPDGSQKAPSEQTNQDEIFAMLRIMTTDIQDDLQDTPPLMTGLYPDSEISSRNIYSEYCLYTLYKLA